MYELFIFYIYLFACTRTNSQDLILDARSLPTISKHNLTSAAFGQNWKRFSFLRGARLDLGRLPWKLSDSGTDPGASAAGVCTTDKAEQPEFKHGEDPLLHVIHPPPHPLTPPPLLSLSTISISNSRNAEKKLKGKTDWQWNVLEKIFSHIWLSLSVSSDIWGCMCGDDRLL